MVYYDELYGGVLEGDGNNGGGGGIDDLVGGARIAIAGETISFVNSADIVNVTGTSVTLQPDTAYKIYATSQAITLNANPPASGKWAYEGHLEIFVSGTGYVVTGTNVVLANALEPDAVNNCVVRFHDGVAIVDVEDHVAGYIVVSATGSTAGTLPYALSSASQEYVAFDATLNGQTIDMGGVITNGEKHVVGNGYAETTLTGAVDCGTSKFTVANLSLQDVTVNGGMMTLGDAFIPSGSTVSVSGGGLAIEKVTGAGTESVIDLGGYSSYQSGAIISGCTITNGRDFRLMSKATDCVFSGNSTIYAHGVYSNCTFCNNIDSLAGGIMVINPASFFGCTFSGSTGSGNLVVSVGASYFISANITDCTLAGKTILQNGALVISGSASVNDGTIERRNLANVSGSVTLTSGAILDLTGNTNATPIAPGGGITFEQGGATVLYGEVGSVSSMFIDNTIASCSITNDGAIVLNGGLAVTSNTSVYGVTFRKTAGDGIYARGTGSFSASNCVFSCNVYTDTPYGAGGIINLSGTNRLVNAQITKTSPPSGQTASGVVNLADNSTYYTNISIVCQAITINAGNNVTIIDGNDDSHVIGSGTYTRINANGTTEPATDADGNTNPIA